VADAERSAPPTEDALSVRYAASPGMGLDARLELLERNVVDLNFKVQDLAHRVLLLKEAIERGE
jgi:hypothetical protein